MALAEGPEVYDRLGLLTPAEVGADNGYRRYRESQLETARLVAMLRRLDMPLTDVARVAAAPGREAAALIQAHWDATERRIASQRLLAGHLRVQLSGDEEAMTCTRFSSETFQSSSSSPSSDTFAIPSLQTCSVRRSPGSWVRRRSAAGWPADVFVIYHGAVNEDSDGPVEVCVPMGAEYESSDVSTRREPAHREAYT